MTLRCLVDECGSPNVARYLLTLGYDVEFVGDIMPQADDADVLAYAAHTNRLLVTADKGFGERVFRQGARHAGVLFLRALSSTSEEKVRLVSVVLPLYEDRLPGNYAVSAENTIRIVRTPPLPDDAQ